MSDTTDKQADRAVALHYDGKNAPHVSAKGDGALAQRIIEIAKEHGVYLHDDPELVGLLSRLDLNDEVPENLYLAIARIIAFAYTLAGKMPENYNPPS